MTLHILILSSVHTSIILLCHAYYSPSPSITLIPYTYIPNMTFHPHAPCHAYMQLVEMFGKESSCSNLVSALLQQLHSLSLPLFQSGTAPFPGCTHYQVGVAWIGNFTTTI